MDLSLAQGTVPSSHSLNLTQVSSSLSLSLCRRVSHAAIYSQCHLCVPAPPRPTLQTPAAHVPSRERWLWSWIRAGGKVVWRLFGSIRVLPVNTCPVVWQQWHSPAVTVVVLVFLRPSGGSDVRRFC